MGCSSNNDRLCENEAENLFRDILFSFHLQRNTFQDVAHSIREIVVQKQSSEDKEERTYAEEAYVNLINQQFLDLSSDYKKFHFALFPTFDVLFDGLPSTKDTQTQVDKPEFTFSLFCIGYLTTETEKWKLVREILELGEQEFNYGNVEDLVEQYLTDTLKGATNRVNKQIQEIEDGKVIVNNRLIAESLKLNANRVNEFFSNEEYIRTLKDMVLESIRRKVPRTKLEPEKFRDHLLKRRVLEEMQKEFPWFFNAVDLRCYYWERFSTFEREDYTKSP